MCQFTNSQTRKLLNLPETTVSATVPSTQPTSVESILGIDGSDIKNEPGTSKSKKSTKKAATATAAAAKGSRSKKRDSNDLALQHKCEDDDNALLTVSSVVRDGRAPKIGKAKANKNAPNSLLQPKTLNQRERNREAQQKKDDRSV